MYDLNEKKMTVEVGASKKLLFDIESKVLCSAAIFIPSLPKMYLSHRPPLYIFVSRANDNALEKCRRKIYFSSNSLEIFLQKFIIVEC